jgi:YidC/Oxa1 family membrane protein insertase
MNERTRLILFIAISVLVLVAYMPLLRHFGLIKDPPPPTTAPTTLPAPATGATTVPGTGEIAPLPLPEATTQATVPTVAPVPQVAQTGNLPTLPSINVAPHATPITIGSAIRKDSTYALGVRVVPQGGGIDEVVLNRYKAFVDSEDPFIFEQPYAQTGTTPFSTPTITINGQSYDISQRTWNITHSGDTVRLTLDLAAPGTEKPLVRLEKTFTVSPRSDDPNTPQGYEIGFSQTVTNLSDQALDISTTIIGPTFPPSEMSRGADRQLIGGYKGRNSVVIQYHALESFTKDAPTKNYTTNDDNELLLWIGAGSNYFNAIVRPQTPWIANATATLINLDAKPREHQVKIALQTASTGVMAPGASSRIAADLFFGPRLRSLLHSAYYSAGALEYFHTLEISGSCTYCTFSWLVDFLMWLLGIFHIVFRDWGLAIIALVFIVRAVLHPITKRSQVNMAKMAKMGPEMERIKKKYGDDKEAMNRAMMEFYKNHGATPIMGCLPMFLQMPIWIALYSGLSTTFELRQEPFLYGLTWIKDLAKPDHLIELQQPVSFLFIYIDGLNVIPLLLMVAFFLQFKLQPKPPAMTPEQKQQQKMMMWMTTLLFPLMLYPMPSGLNIYIFASTVFGVIESKIIRRHIDQQEALKATGVQFVEGEVIDPHRSKEPEKKPGKLLGWFAQLQQRADELRQDAEKKSKKKR